MSSSRGSGTHQSNLCWNHRESRWEDFIDVASARLGKQTVGHDVLSIPLCNLGSYASWEAGWITFLEGVIILIDFPARKFSFQPTFCFLHFLVKLHLIIWGRGGGGGGWRLHKEADTLNGYPFYIDLSSDLASFWLFIGSKLLAHIF